MITSLFLSLNLSKQGKVINKSPSFYLFFSSLSSFQKHTHTQTLPISSRWRQWIKLQLKYTKTDPEHTPHLWSFQHEQAYKGLLDLAPHTVQEACSWRPAYIHGYKGNPPSNIKQAKQFSAKKQVVWNRGFLLRHASIKLESFIMARHMSRSFLYGDIRLATHIKPASAKSFATSPESNNLLIRKTK